MDTKLILGGALVIFLVSFVFLNPTNTVYFEAKTAQGEAFDVQNNELTLYPNYGFSKEVTNVSLPLGIASVSFVVPSTIDTSSIYFFDLSNPSTLFLRNVFVAASDNEYSIIQKSMHKNISIQTTKEAITGELISFSDNLILKTDKGTLIIPKTEITKIESSFEPIYASTLSSTLVNGNIGSHRIGVSYLFSGISWEANYVVILGEKLDLNSFIQVKNNVGRDFENVSLKFVAGDVKSSRDYSYPMPAYESKNGAMVGQSPSMETSSLAEYHMYTLKEPATLKDGEETQLTLHTLHSIPFEKTFVFKPSYSNKVQFGIRFQNKQTSETPLPIPLPAGNVRVYEADNEGKLQFIGEDNIDHTAENSNVSLAVGYAFDIVANRTTIEYRTTNCTSTTSYEVVLRNEKDIAANVEVVESFYGDWSITSESQAHKSKTASEVVWEMQLPSKQSKTLQYTILQRWCE